MNQISTVLATLQKTTYSLLLYVLSEVPMHTNKRLVVIQSLQTKREMDVMISCKLAPSKSYTPTSDKEPFLHNVR